MSQDFPRFKFPLTLLQWPWKRQISPHFEEGTGQSLAWVKSFKPFEPNQQEKFDLCNIGLLSALGYPQFTKEHFRLGCDLVNFLFVADEHLDALSKEEAHKLSDEVLDALRNPTVARPEGEFFLAEMARQLVVRAMDHAEPDAFSLREFVSELCAPITAVIDEMGDHQAKHVRSVKDYLALRRNTSATAAALALIGFSLNLPEDVEKHPVVVSLKEGAVMLIAIVNDVYSYVMEQSRGFESHNVVTVVMHEYHLDHNGAMEWLETYLKEEESRFLENMKCLPSWGEDIDERVREYVAGMGYWVRGNDTWSKETPRYFSDQVTEIDGQRWIALQPSSDGYVKKHITVNA